MKSKEGLSGGTGQTGGGITMPRYIDVDDFDKRLSNPPYTIYNGDMFAEWFEECFKTQPTADVEPVRHGRWVKTNPYHYKCSSCGARVWIKFYPLEEHKFCWHCGTKMDGGEEDATNR